MNKTKELEYVRLVTKMVIPASEATYDEIKEYVFDTKKQIKLIGTPFFFNMRTNTKYVEAGHKMKILNMFTPFYFSAVFREYLPEKSGFVSDVYGLLRGEFRLYLLQDDKEITIAHEMHVRGINKFWHNYYKRTSSGHDKYFDIRKKALKGILKKEALKKGSK